MDVDDPFLIMPDEIRAEDLHEAGQHDHIDVMILQLFEDPRFESLLAAGLLFRNDGRLDAGVLRPLQTVGDGVG